MAIQIHVAAALAALALGLAVILLKKGTYLHRNVGRLYAAAMYTVSLSGFFIFEVTGGLSIFHWFSVQAAVLVTAGLLMPLRLRHQVSEWYVWHMRFMVYSYLTLLAAGSIQFLEDLPFTSTWVNVIVFLQLPVVAGWLLVEYRAVPYWRKVFAS